jgi:hypothetical protein
MTTGVMAVTPAMAVRDAASGTGRHFSAGPIGKRRDIAKRKPARLQRCSTLLQR